MSPTTRKKSEWGREKKYPDHLLFIEIQFYKSGSLLCFSEERKYSYWNVYSTLPSLQELFMYVRLMQIPFSPITHSAMAPDCKQSNKETKDEIKIKQNSQYLSWCHANQWAVHHRHSYFQYKWFLGDLLSISRPMRPTVKQLRGYESFWQG